MNLRDAVGTVICSDEKRAQDFAQMRDLKVKSIRAR